MRKLNTIQKRNQLNEVYSSDERFNGVNHKYEIYQFSSTEPDAKRQPLATIQFQKGGRAYEDSISGVIDTDLLEIVRDRLLGFQSGDFSCRENAIALTHIEEALMWLNRRVEDRFERKVLGKNKK